MNKLANTYSVNSFQALLSLCKEIRDSGNTDTVTIKLSDNNERGHFVFDYDNFVIVCENYTLTDNLYAKIKDENGIEYTTFKTPTLKIYGKNNVFINLHVVNDKGDSKIYGQEVALGIYNGNNYFLNCTLESEQDTLFIAPFSKDLQKRYTGFLPDREIEYFYENEVNYFFKCSITGTVDFIFGAGNAIFSSCDLISANDGRESYVFAPSTEKYNDFGFYATNCRFLRMDKTQDHNTYYARPWRDYGKAVIDNCYHEPHISKDAFSDWSDVNRSKTCRFEIRPFNEEMKLASSYGNEVQYNEANKRLESIVKQYEKYLKN